MASNDLLLGPPGLRPDGVDCLQLNAINPITPHLGFPNNESFVNSNTVNPCLDLFFSVLPSTPNHVLVNLLAKAWSYDPLTTLKLVCNLRGVRGTGKSDKESFYKAALWLHQNHPKTLACNVRILAEFGCYKDSLEILYRLLEGEKVRENAKQELQISRKGNMFKSKSKTEMARAQKESLRNLRKERDLNKAKKAYERYCTDPVFKFLHDCVADMFAENLKKDIKLLNSGEVRKIGLASKWCPSLGSAYDKATLICESIARRMFPRESDPDYEGIDEAHYAFRVRDRLRKQVLVPLHKALELPELYMTSKQWNALPYNRVPSVAMKKYRTHFFRRDNQRFSGYIEDVRNEDDRIAAGALLPHEIVAYSYLMVEEEVAELQWRRMVDDLKRKGKLNNCIAVCDISDSMDGTPLEACVALGLLTSELNDDPWKGKVITLGSNPQLHLIQGDSLLSKTRFLRKKDGGENVINFEIVFDKILQVAVDGKLKEDQMIKRIFVFSGMGLDESFRHNSDSPTRNISNDSNGQGIASNKADYMLEHDSDPIYEVRPKVEERQQKLAAKSWESMYGEIQKKFQDKGFKMPEIVFWNLNDNTPAIPVPSDQGGVALVSGFSKNLMKLFLDNGGIIDPVTVMNQAISREMYQKLCVYD